MSLKSKKPKNLSIHLFLLFLEYIYSFCVQWIFIYSCVSKIHLFLCVQNIFILLCPEYIHSSCFQNAFIHFVSIIHLFFFLEFFYSWVSRIHLFLFLEYIYSFCVQNTLIHLVCIEYIYSFCLEYIYSFVSRIHVLLIKFFRRNRFLARLVVKNLRRRMQ